MRKNSRELSLMCRIQGRIFEKSLIMLDCSSPFFIKNYMNGEIAKVMDDLFFLNTTISEQRVLLDMKSLSFGKIKYTNEEMYWMGYIYRYISYIYEIDSKRLFKLIPGSILVKYYWPGSVDNMDKVVRDILKDNKITFINNDYLMEKAEQNISNKLENFILKV